MHQRTSVAEPLDTWFSSIVDKFTADVNKCIVLNNMCWAIWALLMIDDRDVCNDQIFNYTAMLRRAQLSLFVRKHYGIC